MKVCMTILSRHSFQCCQACLLVAEALSFNSACVSGSTVELLAVPGVIGLLVALYEFVATMVGSSALGAPVGVSDDQSSNRIESDRYHVLLLRKLF